MLERIVNETMAAKVAAIKGVDDILTAFRNAVNNQVVSVLGDVGGEAGNAVKSALLGAASLPKDIVERVIKGSGAWPQE